MLLEPILILFFGWIYHPVVLWKFMREDEFYMGKKRTWFFVLIATAVIDYFIFKVGIPKDASIYHIIIAHFLCFVSGVIAVGWLYLLVTFILTVTKLDDKIRAKYEDIK